MELRAKDFFAVQGLYGHLSLQFTLDGKPAAVWMGDQKPAYSSRGYVLLSKRWLSDLEPTCLDVADDPLYRDAFPNNEWKVEGLVRSTDLVKLTDRVNDGFYTLGKLNVSDIRVEAEYA